MDLNERWQDSSFGVKVGFWLLLTCLYLLYMKDKGDYLVNKGFVHVNVLFTMYVTGQSVIWASRYAMKQFGSNGHSGSILGKPVIIKDSNGINWAIFNTGESLDPIHMRGKLSTGIVPESQLNEAGGYYFCRTFTKKVPINFLPSKVTSYLKRHESLYNLKNIYFGKYSAEFIHENPDIMDYEELIEKKESEINMRNDMLEGRHEVILEMNEFAKELVGEKKGMFDFLKRSNQQDERPKD